MHNPGGPHGADLRQKQMKLHKVKGEYLQYWMRSIKSIGINIYATYTEHVSALLDMSHNKREEKSERWANKMLLLPPIMTREHRERIPPVPQGWGGET